MEALQTHKLVCGGERRGRWKGGRKDVERRLGGVGGRWAVPLPAHVFMPSGLRPPMSLEGAFTLTQSPFFLQRPSAPTRSLPGLPPPSPLPLLPAFLPPSPCTCSSFMSPEQREGWDRKWYPNSAAIHTINCLAGNLGGSGCSCVQQILIEHLLCARPSTRSWGHQGDRADPDFAFSHQLAAVLVGGGRGGTGLGPEVAGASPGPAYLRLLVPVASNSL